MDKIVAYELYLSKIIFFKKRNNKTEEVSEIKSQTISGIEV